MTNDWIMMHYSTKLHTRNVDDADVLLLLLVYCQNQCVLKRGVCGSVVWANMFKTMPLIAADHNLLFIFLKFN